MNEYKDLALRYQNYTDKIKYQGSYSVSHAYAVVYDRLFQPFKDREVNFLEIGLNVGGNIAICSEYFKNVNHYGIDIADYLDRTNLPILSDSNKFTFYHGSFDEVRIIEQASQREYDIILEDASHQLQHQQKAIQIYLPLLKQGGLMIIEDIQDVSHLDSIYSFIDLNKYFAYTIDLRYNKNRYDDILVIIEHRDSKYS